MNDEDVYTKQLEAILGTIVVIGVGVFIFKLFKPETIYVRIRWVNNHTRGITNEKNIIK